MNQIDTIYDTTYNSVIGGVYMVKEIIESENENEDREENN